MHRHVQWLKSWNALGCAKVAVKINSEEEAREMERVAKENGVPVPLSSLSHALSFFLSSARVQGLSSAHQKNYVRIIFTDVSCPGCRQNANRRR
jgi:hypothetical protein